MQDPNCKLFILQPRDQSGSRLAFSYSFTGHPQFGCTAAAYFDTANGWGPCFGPALRPRDNGYGLAFLWPPVDGSDKDLYEKANKHLARSFGLNDSVDLTSGFPDKWRLGKTSTLRIYAVEDAPAGSMAAPRLGAAPAGVSFSTEVSSTVHQGAAEQSIERLLNLPRAQHSSACLACAYAALCATQL
jgi:hypothetical protein